MFRILLKWGLVAILVISVHLLQPVHAHAGATGDGAPCPVSYPSPDEDGKTICIQFDMPASSTRFLLIPPPPKFYLFTSENPDDPIELKPVDNKYVDADSRSLASQINEKAPRFNRRAPLKILIHGFQSGSDKPFPKEMMQVYLNQTTEEVPNVILVDWSPIAGSPLYPRAAGYTKFVGDKTADLIEGMLAERLTTLHKVHIVGHSLGAHVAGYVGEAIASKRWGKVSRITGLDPAGPEFCSKVEDRLDPSDADFVDVIHTDDGSYCGGFFSSAANLAQMKFGHDGTLGHVDFYPNGGTAQPGCSQLSTCNHSRAHHLMAESITKPKAFVGHLCANWAAYTSGRCKHTKQIPMGEFTPRTARGKYFLRTS